MKKISFCILFLSLSFTLNVYAHEQWFFYQHEIDNINKQPIPLVFSQLGFFNTALITLTSVLVFFWIYFDKPVPQLKWVDYRFHLSALILRITTGSMLLFSSLGLLPIVHATSSVPTLFAPDLIIPPDWLWLKWIELALSILLLTGTFIRICSLLLIGLLFFSILIFGKAVFQYIGFYLSVFLFLTLEGGGYFSLINLSNFSKKIFSMLILQILTGLNFLYSAISMKLLQPNLDIALLEKTHAFTFGLPYDYFAFAMCVVEIALGILIIAGAKLNFVAILLLFLFTFLSINVSENIFLHLFIYGILLSFIILKGINIFKLSTNDIVRKL